MAVAARAAKATDQEFATGFAVRLPFPLRWLLLRPRDSLAVLAASAAVVTILINALFLQTGPHPAPIFGTTTTLPAAPPRIAAVSSEPANPLPRPRPSEAGAPLIDTTTKADDPMGSLVRATSTPAASGSARVAAVQRALTDFGYGQLKPTGTIGADTQLAIQRFERERKMPITGQVSDRLIRELGLATGRSIQ